MKFLWSKTVFPIAAIFSFRMLGLFLLIPVFTLYANNLRDATPTLIGFALGGYGLTQGLLQMPFGMLSDKIGRKSMITIGLILFAFGSLIGALSESIYGMIIARILQGTGAIGSVLIALVADLTPDEQRTKAMAVIGMTIGTSFSLAMVISPAITRHFGLSGIFYLTCLLAITGIAIVHLVIPTPRKERFHSDSEANPALFKSVINNRHLQRLNLSIFCQHFILTATFYAIPLILSKQVQLGHLSEQWHFYLPLMIASFLMMVPFIILAEKNKLMKEVFIFSVLLSTAAQALLIINNNHWLSLCVLMFAYFIAFNILEASLPSLVSKQADSNNKGTAMGVYSTCQFLGIFSGGAMAGILYQWNGNKAIFMANACVGFMWLLVAFFIKPQSYLSTLILHFNSQKHNKEELLTTLLHINGVKDVIIATEEEVIYLRIARDSYRPGSAEGVLKEINL